MEGGESTNAQHSTHIDIPRSPHTDPKMKCHLDLQSTHSYHSHLPDRAGDVGEGASERGIEGILREEDWRKFRDLLLELNLSLTPIRSKTTKKQSSGKKSLSRGTRELKNLECGINYERVREEDVGGEDDVFQ